MTSFISSRGVYKLLLMIFPLNIGVLFSLYTLVNDCYYYEAEVGVLSKEFEFLVASFVVPPPLPIFKVFLLTFYYILILAL